MTWISLFFLLCILGLLDAFYLYYKSAKKHPLVCPLGSNCNAVLESKWNRFLGIKNEIWGALYYAVLLVSMLLAIVGFFRAQLLMLFLPVTVLGLLYSVYLTGVQIIKIKEYCLYCLFSALITLLLVLVSMGLQGIV